MFEDYLYCVCEKNIQEDVTETIPCYIVSIIVVI